MGAVADSAVLTWFLGIAIAINGIVATVYASYYIDQFIDDPPLQGDSTTVYYTAVYVRGLGVVTSLLAILYVGWVYLDSRHTFEPDKKPGAGGFSFQRLQRSRLHTTYGVDVEKLTKPEEKKKAMQAHKGKLLGLGILLFVMWFIPAILYFAKGWLYKYSKNESYEKETEGTVCTYNKDTETCKKVEDAGISCMFELLWLLLFVLVAIVGQQSKGPEVDSVYKKLKEAADKQEKDAKAKNDALEAAEKKHKEMSTKMADDLKLFQGQLGQAVIWKPGDDLPFPKDGKAKEPPKPGAVPPKKKHKHWTLHQVRSMPLSPNPALRGPLSPGLRSPFSPHSPRSPFLAPRSPISPFMPGGFSSGAYQHHYRHHGHVPSPGHSHGHTHGHGYVHGHAHPHGHTHLHGHTQPHGHTHAHAHGHDSKHHHHHHHTHGRR